MNDITMPAYESPYKSLADDHAGVTYKSAASEMYGDSYPLIQSLLYDTPLMLLPSKANILHQVLQGHMMGKPPVIDAAAFSSRDRNRSYAVTTKGVAVIPVYGSLTHRAGFLDAMSGMTSYRRLKSQLHEAERDQDVKAVLLDVDSPGGAVSGLYQLTDAIRALDSIKPVWAVSNEDMFSAAYAIGASTRRIVASRSAMAGSIGVVMMHLDQSKADEKAGRKYTPIFAGHHKVDGNSHEPLSDSARSTYQHIVDDAYSLFVEHVAAGRASMSKQAVIDTQAQIYTAPDALDIGLIDGIASFDETLDALESEVNRVSVSTTLASASNQSEVIMTTEKNGAEPQFTQTDIDAAREEGKAEGLKAGVEQEQSRVNAILSSESAAGRIDGTLSACISNGLDAEAADKFLAAAPRAVNSNPFVAAMNELGNPGVAADAGADSDLTEDQLADRAVSNYYR